MDFKSITLTSRPKMEKKGLLGWGKEGIKEGRKGEEEQKGRDFLHTFIQIKYLFFFKYSIFPHFESFTKSLIEIIK